MRKTIVVHCDTDRALANAINRGEDNVNTKDRHDRIRNLYNDIINMIKAYGSCEIVRYDYSDSKAYDNVYKFIKVRLNEDGV